MVESSKLDWQMKCSPPRCLALIAASLVLFGCGKSTDSVLAKNARLFQTADPKLRQDWDTAAAAVKTNGYATAILALRVLQRQDLATEQRDAVEQALRAVGDKLYTAAERGDAAAKEDLEQLKKTLGR